MAAMAGSVCVITALSLLVLLCNASFDTPSMVLRATAGGRIRGARDRFEKDFVLGGLFPIHAAEEGGGACGEVRLERGLERMEAMLFAIDQINSNATLLNGLTLGYDIRDTCNSENIGLDETVDLVITGSQLDIESCQSGNNMGVNNTVQEPPTSGIVGAAASRVSVPVASLVRLFSTPQVSYASSSAILSNRDRYEYFFRTIPPDNLQARAMIDVMLHFNWTYVSTIYSLNPYGEPGINEFQTLAEDNGICIDLDVGIDDDFSEDEFSQLAKDLIASEANVVILFTSQDNAENLLQFIADSSASTRFIWIASDAWARSINVVHRFNRTAAGLYGFAPLTNHLGTFQNYFSQLTVDSNLRNPWFKEFFMAVVNCTVNETSGTRSVCNKTVSVVEASPRYEQGNFIPLVVDAVYTYAEALQSFLDENCGQPLQWFRNNRTCFNQTKALTGAALLQYIQRADFTSITGNRVLFDSDGNVEGKYEIINYQAESVSGVGLEYKFKKVAVWDSSIGNNSKQQALVLQPSAVPQFGFKNLTNEVLLDPPISQCGRCGLGQHRQMVQSACCGFCEPCLGQEYSNNSMAVECNTCEREFWGNDPLVGSNRCTAIPESILDFNHFYSIIIMIIALIGLVGVAFTCIVFGLYWKTPVVKSSGREQMIILLSGITISFISAFFFVSPPSTAICGIQRWLLWTGFSVMFGALLVKIVRVARIFLRKNSVTRPRFTEPHYQVLFTAIIVLLQWVIVAISLAVANPEVRREVRQMTNEPLEFPTLIVTCVPDKIVFLVLSVAYETVLIITCTILGGLSFTYPANFNESMLITFCSLSTLVIWVAFVITYFATQSTQEFQNIAISLAVVMTGYAVLICIFGQKLFIILFLPHKNVVTKFSQHETGDLNTITPGTSTGTYIERNLARLSVGQSLVPSTTATPILERKEGSNGIRLGDYMPPDVAAPSKRIAESKFDSNNFSSSEKGDHSVSITVTSDTPQPLTTTSLHSTGQEFPLDGTSLEEDPGTPC